MSKRNDKAAGGLPIRADDQVRAEHQAAALLPDTLTYDDRGTGAHGVGCVLFPDGWSLDTAGWTGADPRGLATFRAAMMREIVARRNAHADLLAACEFLIEVDASWELDKRFRGQRATIAGIVAAASKAIAKARGAS